MPERRHRLACCVAAGRVPSQRSTGGGCREVTVPSLSPSTVVAMSLLMILTSNSVQQGAELCCWNPAEPCKPRRASVGCWVCGPVARPNSATAVILASGGVGSVCADRSLRTAG
jgi:hypothetical protein